MGWDQTYTKTDNLHLLKAISGQTTEQFFQTILEQLGVKIIKVQEIILDGYYGFKGQRITLSDGRVFSHRHKNTTRGDDSGCDHYDWAEEIQESESRRT